MTLSEELQEHDLLRMNERLSRHLNATAINSYSKGSPHASSLFACCLFAFDFAPAWATAESDPELLKGLEGRWSVDMGINQGVEVPTERIEGTFAIITPTTITTFDKKEKEAYKASYTIDLKTSPMQIDMVASRGGVQVKSLGIIKFEPLDADKQKRITLVYSLDPTERPSSFESPEGSKLMLFEMSSNLPVPGPR
jgi:uncharacterized protein (TIGR03067 family)